MAMFGQGGLVSKFGVRRAWAAASAPLLLLPTGYVVTGAATGGAIAVAAYVDPLAVLAARSPGARGKGALAQTKPARPAERTATKDVASLVPSERVLTNVRTRPPADATVPPPLAVAPPAGVSAPPEAGNVPPGATVTTASQPPVAPGGVGPTPFPTNFPGFDAGGPGVGIGPGPGTGLPPGSDLPLPGDDVSPPGIDVPPPVVDVPPPGTTTPPPAASAVPEPATWQMMFGGVFSIAFAMRSRRARRGVKRPGARA